MKTYKVIGDWPRRNLPMNSEIVILQEVDGKLIIQYTWPDGSHEPEKTT